MARRTTAAALGAVRGAAEEVLAARGVTGFTVEEVASRSGVAKTTIYRHWDSAHDLLLETIADRVAAIPTPNHGDLGSDLHDLYRRFIGISVTPGLRPLLLDMLAAAGRDPDLARAHQSMMEQRTQPVRTVLELARHRGELGPGVDLDLAADVVQGAIFYRLVIRDSELAPDELDHLVAAVLAGVRALG